MSAIPKIAVHARCFALVCGLAFGTSGGAQSAPDTARPHRDSIEVQAKPMPGNPLPTTMGEQLAQGYQGRIIAQFVIDTTGRVLRNSIKIVHGNVTHDDAIFATAVRIAIEDSRYYPALVNGRKVRELVEQPFLYDSPPPVYSDPPPVVRPNLGYRPLL